MLSILICDDDDGMIDTMRSIVESVLHKSGKKARIHTCTDASLVSDQLLSGCDIALLDIDLEEASYNGMDVARRMRTLRSDTVIIFVTNFIEYAPEGYEVHHIVPLSEGGADTPENMILVKEDLHDEITAAHSKFYDWRKS